MKTCSEKPAYDLPAQTSNLALKTLFILCILNSK